MEYAVYASEIIKQVVTEFQLDFDTIVFRGMSGALMAPLVAAELKKELLMVRKEDGSHASFKVEGNIATQRFIVLDDLIASGTTMQEIFAALHREGKNHAANGWPFNLREAMCAGIILYHDYAEMREKDFYFEYKDNGEHYKGKLTTTVYPFRLIKRNDVLTTENYPKKT